ncbi:hypothetical protein SprV_0902666200 [Sparganum proliferum]
MQQAVASVMENEERPTELESDGDPSIKLDPNAVSPGRFVNYAVSLATSHNSTLTYQFLPLRCTEADQMTLKAVNSLFSSNNVFGIYSESPFLRPVTLLRPVQFACPPNVLLQYPDPENMVRTLRDLADQKVTSIPLLAILSGAKPNAASLGFYTGYLTYSFTLEVDNNTMRILVDQSRRPHDGADKYRLILRLAWATAGLYMPRDKSNPSRVLACEVLPRCLSVRVARRNVTLPDPIFHGGQAQKFGHRLRFAIDITDKIVTRSNYSVRGRGVEIDLTWLHAPLEDHALPLLEMVGSGSCTPILNHLLNLPLIQVTLDRAQPIPEFVRMFSSAVAGKPVTDPPPSCKLPRLPSETPEALVGVYDFCMSSDRVIAASETLAMIKSKLTSEDDLQSDGWIPVSLLCPLALTRIEIPVRSVNCDHLQCFDLSSYLTINKRRPRWSCPVCSSPAPFRDLRRDDFFAQLMADQSLKDAQMVHVDASGHWRETSRPTESDPSVAVSSMGLIPGISTYNPTTAAVPSLPNGTSTMLPCILESDLSTEPVAPIEPDATQSSGCVVLIDDDDDDDQVVDATPPEQPTFAHPTSFNDCYAPSPPVVVTDEQPAKLPSAEQGSAPTKLFVDLAASSDEEPDVTMAPTPPLSNPQPSVAPAPSSISPTATESCSLPAVIPSPSLARLPLGIALIQPAASQPLDLTSHATQPPPHPAADAAAVSAAGTSSTPQASPPPNKPNKPIGQASRRTRKPQVDIPTRREEILQSINSPHLIEYCQMKKLLPTKVRCHCSHIMTQQILRQHTDGYLFRCARCRRKKALRTGSIFENSRLTIRKAMKACLSFISGARVKECVDAVGVDHSTAVAWYATCRNVCSKALLKEVKELGGPGVEVQVHETLINRSKGNVGRPEMENWILGMYDTSQRRALFEQVEDRSWPSLRAVITKWVARGSVIVTDDWGAYRHLPTEGYEHLIVKHSRQFVDPVTGRHTNSIKAYWSQIKRKLRDSGPVSGRAIWAHVDEMQYRLWFGIKTHNLSAAWETFLAHIAEAYPVESDAIPTNPLEEVNDMSAQPEECMGNLSVPYCGSISRAATIPSTKLLTVIPNTWLTTLETIIKPRITEFQELQSMVDPREVVYYCQRKALLTDNLQLWKRNE